MYQVRAYPKPVVAILSTGNEITDLQTPFPTPQSAIWDTNRPSLQAALEGMGYDVLDLGIVPDEYVSIESFISLFLSLL